MQSRFLSYCQILLVLISIVNATVLIEVHPAPSCGNCFLMMRDGLLPLVEAGFTGDQVQLIMAPWSGEEAPDWFGPDGRYLPDQSRDAATAIQVCAMRGALNQPVDIDSPAMVAAVKFMVCDYTERFSGRGGPERIKVCAAQAGLPYEGPNGTKTCEIPETGLNLMKGPAYSKVIRDMKGRPYSSPPHLFLNGQLLNCPSPTFCDSTGPLGQHKPLPKAGTLKDVACSLLDPAPAICSAAMPAVTAAPVTTTYCENCWEVGSFHWDTKPRDRGMPAPVLLIAGMVALMSFLSFFAWRRLHHARNEERKEHEREPLHAGSADAGHVELLYE